MKNELNPLSAEQEFFSALIASKIQALDELLVDDFILVDVMRGAEITKPELLAAVASGQVRFEAIEPSGARVRNFGGTAIVNGRTEMRGRARGIRHLPCAAGTRMCMWSSKEDCGWLRRRERKL
jgi:Domain of unknown function (DUF4440)